MRGPAVVFDNVSLQLGGTQVLDAVSFRVEAGALHCLVGPNGGGKTSLVRALLGQMPHSGVIRFEGGPAKPLGYVPQLLDFDRNVPMTVNDVMALLGQRRPAFLGAGRATRAATGGALERTGVAGLGGKPFGSLSGGERQRVLLAQAITPVPWLLILDEPTAGIDEAGILLVETLVAELHKSGVTILWINHDLGQVRRIAQSVTGINQRVIFDGPPHQVAQHLESSR
ncbi:MULTISPECIES: metal ABC transporter ATP-binding protein [unclassified Pseudomonas]|uniref:metal ABC transporter ATP-binding protein n=1 Tax=Pseudomonas TaxID=286 RepID=UPI000537B71B|nr:MULTISPECIES: metal ABC transporter ATP-binding protein [unclassified Pseudomonas]MBD0685635.1 manganese ABC transporter ATP-binding protein [Pseudomonas sp. PSB18]CDF95964.1 ABC transporter in pyoverdin gene cluster,ATP-binding component [Pseudomonas sp. SHC52]